MNNKITKEITLAVSSIDFNKIHKVMKLLNWQWLPLGRVPDPYDLREKAIDLCIRTIEESFKANKEYCISTGGFSVSAEVVEGELKYLNVTFALEQYDSW